MPPCCDAASWQLQSRARARTATPAGDRMLMRGLSIMRSRECTRLLQESQAPLAASGAMQCANVVEAFVRAILFVGL